MFITAATVACVDFPASLLIQVFYIDAFLLLIRLLGFWFKSRGAPDRICVLPTSATVPYFCDRDYLHLFLYLFLPGFPYLCVLLSFSAINRLTNWNRYSVTFILRCFIIAVFVLLALSRSSFGGSVRLPKAVGLVARSDLPSDVDSKRKGSPWRTQISYYVCKSFSFATIIRCVASALLRVPISSRDRSPFSGKKVWFLVGMYILSAGHLDRYGSEMATPRFDLTHRHSIRLNLCFCLRRKG